MDAETFVRRLRTAGIVRIADVRRFPSSRRNPQFDAGELAAALAFAGIVYEPFPDLGGRRRASPDSPNRGLRNSGFRGYADWMEGAAFADAYRRLLKRCSEEPTAAMCAETPWWKCHRRLIADAAVLLDGADVAHIVGDRLVPHAVTPAAVVVNPGRVIYPESGGAI